MIITGNGYSVMLFFLFFFFFFVVFLLFFFVMFCLVFWITESLYRRRVAREIIKSLLGHCEVHFIIHLIIRAKWLYRYIEFIWLLSLYDAKWKGISQFNILAYIQ